MTKLLIDGNEIDVPAEYTLLQACETAGAEVPRFCFHERLSVAGNCRMCLVEVKGSPKPVASCAQNVRDLRPGPNGELPVINTKTPLVKKAREGVMEFLLINHPLDCPICDQGGECDLQDQAFAYGMKGKTRYDENKRAVEEKPLGPLVKTEMTRCIHCTRCVRFTTEVAGVAEMGLIGRGEDAEITTYLEAALSSELSGNVVDLCPVGALTSKPYEFNARPWELTKTESIDIMDAVGSNIRVDSRGAEVMRILPRLNEAVNEEWISDKTRHVADGLKVQRLDKPYLRKNGKLTPVSWGEALAAVAEKATGTIGAISGGLAGVEELFALKKLVNDLGSQNVDGRPLNSPLNPKDGRGSYIFNATIQGIEEAGALLIIGSNPRKEAAVLNARIRKRWRMGKFPIATIGEKADLTYDTYHLGNNVESLMKLIEKPPAMAANPMIIIGEAALNRADGGLILGMAARLAKIQNATLNILHTQAATVGALDIGFAPDNSLTKADMLKENSVDLLFNLGEDEAPVRRGAFVVYIGSHGDMGAMRADVILPASAYTEKSATYVNTEGRVQMTTRATFPKGEAKEDWAVIAAIAKACGKQSFSSLNELRKSLYATYPHLQKLGVTQDETADWEAMAKRGGQISKNAFVNPITDFYLTNPIARASKTLAECSSYFNPLKMAAE
jgi:NADH-quinone oxidoreductase subunit G